MTTTPWADPEARVRLVVSILAGPEEPRCLAVRRLAGRLGPLTSLSRPMAFDYTDYYTREMGPGLTRRLAAFRDLVEPDCLVKVKRVCLSLEKDLARQGKRRVNLDPGLLSAGGLVLATTKPQGHRICLAPGIYSELTLYFHQGQYRPLPWTYPDYAGEQMRGLLMSIRRRYLWQRKQERPEGGKP